MVTDPKTLADRGTRIYAEKFQKEYEAKYPGQFVVIDIQSEEAVVALTPEDAVRQAQTRNPRGIFHLIRIGSPGIYRVSYSASGSDNGDWVFGR